MKKSVIIFLLLVCSVSAFNTSEVYEFTLNSSARCVSTDLTIEVGTPLIIDVYGTISYDGDSGQIYGPEGRFFYEDVGNNTFKSSNPANDIFDLAVYAKIAGHKMYVGRQFARYAYRTGELDLCVNDNDVSNNKGEFSVEVYSKDLTKFIPMDVDLMGNISKECETENQCSAGHCGPGFICMQCYKDDQCEDSEINKTYCQDNKVIIEKNKTIGTCGDFKKLCDYSTINVVNILEECNETAYCDGSKCVLNSSLVVQEDKVVNLNTQDTEPASIEPTQEIATTESVNQPRSDSRLLQIVISLFAILILLVYIKAKFDEWNEELK